MLRRPSVMPAQKPLMAHAAVVPLTPRPASRYDAAQFAVTTSIPQ